MEAVQARYAHLYVGMGPSAAQRNVFVERLGDEWVYVSAMPSTAGVEDVEVVDGRIEVAFVRADGSHEYASSSDGRITWTLDDAR